MSVDFNNLSEAEQREVAERLLRIEQSGWRPFWCPDPECSGDPHPLLNDGDYIWVDENETQGPLGQPLSKDVYDNADGEPLGRFVLDPAWAHNHARKDQRLPAWGKPWTVMVLSGRGSGKTRTGVEFVTLCARKGLNGAILGRRGTELENTHVATILEHAHPEFMPEYKSSKDILVWPNGAITYLFSAERPENIRSVNISYAWVDEASHMDEIETAWMNLKLALRIETPGNPIHALITSTPTPTEWTMKMEDDPKIEVRRVSTYANRANLSDDFIADLEEQYEGTRMGRQEIHGEVLRDVEGAFWNDDMYQHIHCGSQEVYEDLLDSMDDRALAVDPAGSKSKRSDETGIIGMGRQDTPQGGRFYVLGDATLKGTPSEWAAQTFRAARAMRVNRIVVERNFGGDMVKEALTNYALLNPEEANDENGVPFRIVEARAVKGKETRAEPLVGKYEQKVVWHVTGGHLFGDLSKVEKEQTTWVPKSRGGRSPSPNRVDAEVWAFTNLHQQVKHKTQSTGRKAAEAVQEILRKRLG